MGRGRRPIPKTCRLIPCRWDFDSSEIVSGRLAPLFATLTANGCCITAAPNTKKGARVFRPIGQTIREVNVGQVKTQVGQPATTVNCRTDINANGSINAADVSLAKSQAENFIATAPAVPRVERK